MAKKTPEKSYFRAQLVNIAPHMDFSVILHNANLQPFPTAYRFGIFSDLAFGPSDVELIRAFIARETGDLIKSLSSFAGMMADFKRLRKAASAAAVSASEAAHDAARGRIKQSVADQYRAVLDKAREEEAAQVQKISAFELSPVSILFPEFYLSRKTGWKSGAKIVELSPDLLFASVEEITSRLESLLSRPIVDRPQQHVLQFILVAEDADGGKERYFWRSLAGAQTVAPFCSEGLFPSLEKWHELEKTDEAQSLLRVGEENKKILDDLTIAAADFVSTYSAAALADDASFKDEVFKSLVASTASGGKLSINEAIARTLKARKDEAWNAYLLEKDLKGKLEKSGLEIVKSYVDPTAAADPECFRCDFDGNPI